ncbi:GTP-binding elongation factor EF-Tu/EF-1A, partial [Helicosporidium sp. ATCC 50920]
MATDINLITDIQKQQGRVRNVCVLAHVDHGKTTLSDHLIASNGLIHPRLAGELRYLDSLPEEQERGITMKSSSISLLHVPTPQCRSSEEGGEAAEISAQDGGSQDSGNSDEGSKRRARGVLINLIDSPGHVDFCSEVSTAVRLSDGALVVVDAVEGVCIQTHAVLRQAWQERVCMCLVVNKVDRLVLELGLEAQEACRRLRAIVAHVNMIVSGFRSEQFLSEADAIVESDLQAVDMERRASAGEDQARGADEEEEEEETFSPLKNNVVFASAGDGWAFRPSFFADLWAGKLQCSPAALERALWGDYAINAKTRRVGAAKPGQKTVFASLALEPIFKIYGVLDSASQQASLDAEAAGAELARMVASLGLQHRIPARSLLGEPRARVRAVLQAWLPLSHAVLDMVVDSLPSPRRAAPLRVPRMLGGEGEGGEEGGKEAAIRALAASDSGASAPTTVYVSKMVAVPLSSFPEERHAAADAEDFLAFGRVFSGVVREGQELWVLHGSEPAAAKERLEEDVGGAEEVPEEEEVDEAEEVNEAEGRAAEKAENAFVAPTSTPPPPSALKKIAARVRPTGLYVMMGRSLERVSEVPAGSVLALRGLGEAILKSATLSSSPAGPALAPARHQTQPILRVGVEPRDARELPRLLQGLRLLQRADPMARVELMPSGECVLCTAGEVHLQ